MKFELNESTFTMYAMKYYDNPTCKGIEEFNDDLKRFRYLKRLFRKFKGGKDLKERLILNHLIIIYNLFGSEAASRMLFYKIERRFWPQLKTFLVFLNFMPEKIIDRDGNIINESEIGIDPVITETLRKI